MTEKQSSLHSKDNAFDLLKLVGAYIVLFSHSFRHFGVAKPAWSLFFTEGSVGVIMFFAITGFVIMPAYERSVQKNQGLWVFYWNRIVRLLPPVVFSFLVITLIDWLIIHESIFRQGYIKYAIKYCFLAKGGGYGDNGITNGVMWTLVPDVVFYLLTPVIYKVMKNKKTWVWLMLILFFWQFNIWDKQTIQFTKKIPYIGARVDEGFSLCFLYEFLIGSFLYFKRDSIICFFQSHKAFVFVFICIFTIFFELYTYTEMIPRTGEMHTPWIGIMVSPLVIVLGYIIKPIRFKVELSYGIFLFHMIIVELLKYLGVSGIKGILVTAVATPIFAFVSNQLIEKPSLALKK